jgi:hypothetical protein
MTDIDYSKNDEIDINNQLFRRARNNISENSEAIKDLDDDDKEVSLKNLEIYGSELINNLKQINYTFEQIESYIVIPSKKIPPAKMEELIERGDNSKVEDVRTPIEKIKPLPIKTEPTKKDNEVDKESWESYQKLDRSKNYPYSELIKLIDYAIEESEKLKEIIGKQFEIEKPESEVDASPSLREKIRFLENVILKDIEYLGKKVSEIEGNQPAYDNFSTYEKIDRSKNYSYEELERKIREAINESERLKSEIQQQADREGITSVEDASPSLLSKIRYIDKDLEDEIRYISNLLRQQDEERNALMASLPPPPPTRQAPPTTQKPDVIFPTGPKQDTTVIEEMYNGTAPISALKRELRYLGFKGRLDTITNWKDVRALIEVYKQPIGSGRYKKGKTPKAPKTPKKTKKQQQAEEALKALSETTEPEVEDIEIDPSEFDYVKTNEPIIELKENLKDIEKVNKSLTNAVNIGQKSPLPQYMSKVYELLTTLIQFIGKTTVLFITRIKKNLNYLDEDQYTKINNEIMKFKNNIQILKDLKYTSLIKETLFNQVEKETVGLYNEINDSIRNYSRLKKYTALEPLKLEGGYFIQSSNPFIMHTITKRFL